MILSVDLASRRVQDNGIALLSADGDRARVEVIPPAALELRGVPDADRFADAFADFADREGVRLVMLDGPQGWRADESDFEHLRVCERATRTPGKTGLPGIVKPATWTRMATFSIALFDALDARGWPRLDTKWSGGRTAIETFPTHAWRRIGYPPLPGKGARLAISDWRGYLTRRIVHDLPAEISHDEIQAVVGGLAGLGLLRDGLAGCDAQGTDPFLQRGSWREGFILSPR
jgi:hypothetical protein